MTLEVLICTIDEGLLRVPKMLLPPSQGISYLVSCQYTTSYPPSIPLEFLPREDVRCLFLEGKGLSRNRNHALEHAEGDILLISDDDETFSMDGFQRILSYYETHSETDIAHFMVDGIGKKYPPQYVSSVEMTLRRTSIVESALHFDTRFGLGSDYLAAGEEDIFLYDAVQKGLTVWFVPEVICAISDATTGSHFLDDVRVQRSKGAVFCYTRGWFYAVYKCLREALGWMVRKHVNPVPLFLNMYDGIHYV